MINKRVLIVEAERTLKVTCGIPQGSVLDPTLWNVYYSHLFEMPVSSRVHSIEYADNLAMIVTLNE